MKYIKESLLITTLCIFTVCQVQAQSARTGIKGGVNFSNLFIDNVDDENMRIGFHAGVYTQFLAPSGLIGIQPELNYSSKGAKAQYNILGVEGEQRFNLNYVDLPVMMVLKLGEDVDIHFGAYAAYLLNASISSEGDLGSDYTQLDRDNFKSMDYGLSGGLAFNFSAISLGIRYNYGLSKIAEGELAKAVLGNSKNGVGQIYLGFNLGK